MTTSHVPGGAIVVGLDGTHQTSRAVAWAADVAARENRPLVLAHAVPKVSTWAGVSGVDLQDLNLAAAIVGRKLLDQACAAMEQQLGPDRVSGVFGSTDAPHLLVDLSLHAHLIVVGSRGHGHVRNMLLGSVSTKTVRASYCPVVVVRDELTPEPSTGIVVGVDGLEGSTEVLEFAFRSASWEHRPLMVVHCFWHPTLDGPSPMGAVHSDFAPERLLVSEALAGLREKYPDVNVSIEIDQGLAEYILSDLTHRASLVVVGTRTHRRFTDFLLGSVARGLVEQAHGPVAVIPLGRAS